MKDEPLRAPQYLVGIDGGGTGTRACVARSDGQALGCGEAGPSGLGQGVEQAWSNVLLALERAFGAAQVNHWNPRDCAIGLGLAGAIVPTQRDDFLARAKPFARIALASDGYTMLLGAHAGRPGAVVAAGTGSIGEALRRDGSHVAIGGWGYPVGDEGGGAWLGLRAVRRAQHAIDGRVSSGPLVRAVQAVVGDNRDTQLMWCKRAGQNAYAALAPLIFDAAATDPFAADLLDRAARELDGVALALDPAGELPLVIAGSVGTRLRGRLAPAVRTRLVEPAGDALDGALRLVRRSLQNDAIPA